MSPYMIKQIKSVQKSSVKLSLLPAAICYIFLVFGIYYFIIQPKRSAIDAFLLGIVIYAVYEFTNLALFKKWTVLTAIIDTLWGGILFATTTLLINFLRTI